MRALLLLSSVAMSCGYSSQYVLRVDGRARAVWQEDHVEVETSGAPLSPLCMQQVASLSRSRRLRLTSGELQLTAPIPPLVSDSIVVTSDFWVPRFYGPAIVVRAAGMAPLLPQPPLFIPPLMLHPGPPLLPGTAVVAGGGGGGGSVGDGRALEVLAAIALVVLPAVAVGLAASRPEDTNENAEAIDQVNAFNDLLRSAGSPCAPTSPTS